MKGRRKWIGGHFRLQQSTICVLFPERIFVLLHWKLRVQVEAPTCKPSAWLSLPSLFQPKSLQQEVCVGVYKNNLHTMVNACSEAAGRQLKASQLFRRTTSFSLLLKMDSKERWRRLLIKEGDKSSKLRLERLASGCVPGTNASSSHLTITNLQAYK